MGGLLHGMSDSLGHQPASHELRQRRAFELKETGLELVEGQVRQTAGLRLGGPCLDPLRHLQASAAAGSPAGARSGSAVSRYTLAPLSP